ncbi:hypothetical protein KA005_07125 [bacterium]|nr:hypothetical protein [bacterium]
MAKQGRPKNRYKSVTVTITATPKLVQYLDDLIKEEGFGNSRAEIAKNFVWKEINRLISAGNLDRRKGSVTDPLEQVELR